MSYVHCIGLIIPHHSHSLSSIHSDTKSMDLFKSILDHPKTALECASERGMLAALQGGCKVPIAVASSTGFVSKTAADAYLIALESARDGVVGKDGVFAADNVDFPQEVKSTDAGAVFLVATRGCVMSLDGKNIVDCTVADMYSSNLENNTETYAKAWASGQVLGDALRKLGAEEILKDIR